MRFFAEQTPPREYAEIPARTLAPGELPTLAVLTMARDEGSMMRRFVDHYAREVGVDNVFIVDDHTSDGSTDALPCPVLRIPYLQKRSFERSRMGIVGGLSAGLLEAYDAVLFADADEFVLADPRTHPSLRHFLAARPARAAIGVMNLNVVHDPHREPPLVDEEPILGQRRLAKFLPLMCKPSIKWQPAKWVLASHGIQCPYTVDPELYMFHMKFADRDRLAASAAHRHHLNATEGRADKTSWTRSGEEMVALLEEITADLDRSSVRRFRPPRARLEHIVRHEKPQTWRATGEGQVEAMRKRRFVTVPQRFVGLV